MFSKKIVALFFTLAFVVLATFMTGNIFLFISFPAAMFVIGATVAMSFIALNVAIRPSEIFKSLFRQTTCSLNQTTVDFFGNSFILVGAIGTFIGLILMLAVLDNPDKLIPGFGMASLTLIYGFILKFIVDSFRITSIPDKVPAVESMEKIGISRGLAVLGIISFTFIISFPILSSLSLFINLPSGICIYGGLAAIFITNSFQDITNSLKGGFGGIYSTVEEAKNAVRVTSNMYNRFMAFGFIGIMIGLLLMFAHIDDPDKFGPGMAMALISFFYAIIIALIVLAFGTAARRQVNWFGEDEKPELFISPAASGLFALGIFLVSFAVMLVSFVQFPT